MKVVIFAGGLGTRLSEETGIRPKPMVEIGGRPMLWHIMKMYSKAGINDFIILLGYKSQVIKEYFANYGLRDSDVTYNFRTRTSEVHTNGIEPWRVTLVETGGETMTAGRIRRAQKYIGNETFCLTYGDGLSDLDINGVIDFHKKEGATVTLTAVQPPGRFGTFILKDDQTRLDSFHEKPKGDGSWINGGFFVVEPEIFNYNLDDTLMWEDGPMKDLSAEGKLAAYRYDGYWQNMDTLRDKQKLEEIWQKGQAPWKTW